MSKNHYAKVIRKQSQAYATRYSHVRGQIDCDAACIAAHEVLGMGPGRAKAFVEHMILAEDEISKMFVEDSKCDSAIEYSKVTLDRVIKDIVGEDNFVPFDERYR